MKLWLLTQDDGGLFEIDRAIVAAETEDEARKLLSVRARQLAMGGFSSRPEAVDRIANVWLAAGTCIEFVPTEAGIIVCDWTQP